MRERSIRAAGCPESFFGPPADLGQGPLHRCLDAVQSPWPRREENLLRLACERRFPTSAEKARYLVEEVERIGAQPFYAPQPLPPIDVEEIHLITWMAIEREEPQGARQEQQAARGALRRRCCGMIGRQLSVAEGVFQMGGRTRRRVLGCFPTRSLPGASSIPGLARWALGAVLLIGAQVCLPVARAAEEGVGPGVGREKIAISGTGQPSSFGSSSAAAACRGLGLAALPALGLLTLGSFAPTDWALDTRYCRAIVAEGVMAAGALAASAAGHPRRPPVFGAGEFDRFFRDAFRSRSRVNNFFAGKAGALWAPIFASSALVLAAPAVGGGGAYRASVSQALPLLWLGIAGNSLPTEIFKKSFGRERPFVRFGNERALGAFGVHDDARQSFYSGHASTAFFTAAFVDPVMAEMVRLRWPQYRLGSQSPAGLRFLRLGQAALFYGLAGGVAYSRIDIDQHYLSDVLASGLFGLLHGRLLYQWGYAGRQPVVTAMPGGRGLQVTWVF